MEPDVSIETSCQIRVAIVPVGGPISAAHLREYYALIARHTRVDLASVASFYTEQQKSPFSHQRWDSGSLSFKLVLAVVGICHLPVE